MAIPWALICSSKPSRDLPALMALLRNASMLICACSVNAAYFGILFLVRLGLGASCWLIIVPPSQKNMDNGSSLFDYGLNNPYNDLIDDFDPYLEYSKRYRNKTAFEDAFYG